MVRTVLALALNKLEEQATAQLLAV